MSMGTTLAPVAVNAFATAVPDRNDTSRSADGPPINTAIFSFLIFAAF
jgi:hypothetical protein